MSLSWGCQYVTSVITHRSFSYRILNFLISLNVTIVSEFRGRYVSISMLTKKLGSHLETSLFVETNRNFSPSLWILYFLIVKWVWKIVLLYQLKPFFLCCRVCYHSARKIAQMRERLSFGHCLHQPAMKGICDDTLSEYTLYGTVESIIQAMGSNLNK